MCKDLLQECSRRLIATPAMSPACFSPSTKQSTVAKVGKTSSANLVHHARCFVQVCVAGQLLQHEVGHIGTRDCRNNGVSPNVFPAPIRPSTSPVRQSGARTIVQVNGLCIVLLLRDRQPRSAKQAAQQYICLRDLADGNRSEHQETTSEPSNACALHCVNNVTYTLNQDRVSS